ncbi:spore germination protein [Alteribacter aurantiacus]|uniref:spore germination protein n=1 Tax=Alteribacter aurantiacus TaxID=254410 RepID=UPI000417E25C|nr:spore germination protein [Alteribacter aurantiacus]
MIHNRLFSKLGLQEAFYSSSDIKIQQFSDYDLLIAYCQPITDTDMFSTDILPELLKSTPKPDRLDSVKVPKDKCDREQLADYLYEGYVFVCFQNEEDVWFIHAAEMPIRQPEESVSEVSVRGPKDGFVEDISTNLGLIRKRLKTPSLVMEEFTIGERSKTKVTFVYLEDILSSKIRDEVRDKLSAVDVDLLTSSEQLEELIMDQKFSLFPLFNYTGRADFTANSLASGRFALVVDGAPNVLLAPGNISYMVKTAEDSYMSFYYSSVQILLRVLGLLITVFLPGFYTALTMHNLSQIPFPLLATISISRIGLPFSNFMEILVMLTMFELFKEAGARLPRGVGQTVAVLGGLIIGDAAIRGGITSPTMLVVVGVTAISSFTLVNQSLAGNLFLIRLYVLLFSWLAGLFGFFIASLSLLIYLSSLKSFGIPYLQAGMGNSWGEFIKAFVNLPASKLRRRNNQLNPKDSTRQGDHS